LNARSDTDDSYTDDHGSKIIDELPKFTEITLHFRRGEKPVEHPITGKVKSPRKLLDWPSSKLIYPRGAGFLAFIGCINEAIEERKHVKNPRYALLQWSENNTPYIQTSHSSK